MKVLLTEYDFLQADEETFVWVSRMPNAYNANEVENDFKNDFKIVAFKK